MQISNNVLTSTVSGSATFDATRKSPKTSSSMKAKLVGLKIASYLTGPICKVREYYFTLYTLDQTCKSTVEKVAKCGLLILGIIVCSILTPFTAPFGALIRGGIAALGSKPYIYMEKEGNGKTLPENKTITIVSHNQCYMTAGYAITDGQVTPASDRERMKANIKKLKDRDPDIICLFEVPDVCDADYIASKLPEYPFIIPVAGPRAIGPSSMMFVASKYQIVKKSIEFVPFVKGVEVTGRAQYSEKGFLSFEVANQGAINPFATIVTTHLQHSEMPADAEDYEKKARSKQMNKITQHLQKKVDLGHAVVLTGDLNLEEEELGSILEDNAIQLRRDSAVEGLATWGGDAWCAALMNKKASKPLVLDYTLVTGNVNSIQTQIFDTGYSSDEFKPDATSDHNLLFSTITIS